MVTCIQCGNALPEGETTCSGCGASAAPGESPEEHAPAGTWSEGDTGEHPRVERTSSPPVLSFRDTPQRSEERPEDVPPLRPERIVRDPDLTPVPGLAVALASQPRPRDEESTGTRPTMGGKARPMGQVVPLRREPKTGEAGPGPDDTRRVAEAAHGAAVTEAEPSAREETPAPPAERSDLSARIRTQDTEACAQRPVLASECLREDLTPTEPGRATLRWVSAVVGTVGAAVVVVLGGATGFALIEGALLAGIAALGMVPMRYEWRAGGVTALGIAGLAVAMAASGVAAVPPFLAIAVTVLGAGLLFRGTYRASSLARWLVGIGLGLGVVWFVGSGTVAGLSVVDISWQSIAGAVVRLTFALLLLLSLLAFMDSSTTGGCRVWGTALLTWYAAFVSLELAVGMWPGPGGVEGGPDSLLARVLPAELTGPPGAEVAAIALAAAAFVALTALAASQVLVVAAGGTVTKRQSDAERAQD